MSVTLRNGEPIALAAVPEYPWAEFRDELLAAVRAGGRVCALFGQPQADQIRLYCLVAQADEGLLYPLTTVIGDRFPALTPDCPQVHLFERELAEQYGVVPEGHPWLKPVRYHASYRRGKDAWGRKPDQPILPCVTDYFQVAGEAIHEVQVGPIHAGVIEPGSFRFQCYGELVYHLEVQHGYQHRGIEPRLIGGPNKRTLPYLETVAGDTTIGHITAYCQAIEGLAGARPSLRAQAIRGIALELERLANHTGDLGALAIDVGFLPTSSYCGRLRGDYLNATGLICGNRFGRGLARPGGVGFDLEPSRAEMLLGRLRTALDETASAVDLLWNTASVENRFEDTCPVPVEAARDLGLVGMVARACGLEQDVRRDFPSGIFRFAHIPVSTWHTGDVMARGFVRWLEIERSGRFVLDQLANLPPGEPRVPVGPLAPESLVCSLAEGWRGECCHVALTDRQGQFARYKIVDPSFHNWIAMMIALRNQQIFDFPLCNKSMNLSYCGFDL